MPDKAGVSAAKVCARCAYSMAIKPAVFLSYYPQDPQPARMSAQATGTQAEFKRDYASPNAARGSVRKLPGC